VDLTVDPDIDQFGPRMTAPLKSTPRNRAWERSTTRNSAPVRSTRSKREPLRSSSVNSAMGRTLTTPADGHIQRADLPRMVRGCRVPVFGLTYPARRLHVRACGGFARPDLTRCSRCKLSYRSIAAHCGDQVVFHVICDAVADAVARSGERIRTIAFQIDATVSYEESSRLHIHHVGM
jgi:hypothetical protein